MTKRLEILKNSLLKKENELAAKIDNHFKTVKQANGQPLNDKRNGRATLNKWEQQNNSIRTLKESIEKTKRSIEIEEGKIREVQLTNEVIPKEITELIEKGELIQWRKHPNFFFVPGVEKARIFWDEKKKLIMHRYVGMISDPEQRKKFARIYNSLNEVLNK